MRSTPTRLVTSISTGSAPGRGELELGRGEQHEVLTQRQRFRGVHEVLERLAEVVDVLGGLPDDEVAERVDVPVREQVSLRQRDDPDARELDQSVFAGQQVFPESQQRLAGSSSGAT